ncbi:MAG: 50S ribosomal protein L2 [Thermoplasmatales archaeon]|nr:50S ribosomal protein L2 [Thermoplasmatales archaeon]
MGKRIISRRRGSGGIYSAPSHKYKADVKYPKGDNVSGVVTEFIHDPGRTAPLAVVDFNGKKEFMLPAEGVTTGQSISIGASFGHGNVLPIGSIPEGTKIFNIEGEFGDGGKFVRSGGTFATIISHGERTVVQLPSGKFKSLSSKCRATIGVVSGGGRPEKPWAKAGKKYHAMRSKAKVYPIVSGVAMNPVDHPHGGGSHQHVGKTSSLPRGAPPGRKVGHIAPKRTGKVK